MACLWQGLNCNGYIRVNHSGMYLNVHFLLYLFSTCSIDHEVNFGELISFYDYSVFMLCLWIKYCFNSFRTIINLFNKEEKVLLTLFVWYTTWCWPFSVTVYLNTTCAAFISIRKNWWFHIQIMENLYYLKIYFVS
jgi:hypothetical protein